ncbi:MAG: hypothetical protein R2756_06020 [Bacteroidales bacterium]
MMNIPLKPWIGTYDVLAVSYGSPGAWDEEWVVTTRPGDTHNPESYRYCLWKCTGDYRVQYNRYDC